VGDVLAKHTNLDANIADAQAVHDKPYPVDPDRAKDQETYEHLENIAEYMMGEKWVTAGLSRLQKMEAIAPVMKALKNSPIAAKLLGTAVTQGTTGAAQTLAHGGSGEEAGMNALMSAGVGAVTGVPEAVDTKLGSVAADVKPTVREMGPGPVRFTQLASENLGPEGQPLSSTRAQRAAQYSSEPTLRYERQAGFKQLQTDLAKEGVRNALTDSNDAMASSNVSPNIQATAVPGPAEAGQPDTRTAWRYISPDGQTSLTAPETRSAMNEIKQRLLDKNWTQGEERQLSQAYDDMKAQLDRHDSYAMSQPIQTHDVEAAVNGVNSWGDAAKHMEFVGQQQMQAAPQEMRQQYLDLLNRRNQLQTDFDNARTNTDDGPNKRNEIMRNIDAVTNQMDTLFQNKGTGQVPQSQAAMADAFKTHQLASAFQKMQNTMDQHFNLYQKTAADINRPRVADNLDSLSDHIEQVRKKYGDVLSPVIGDQGLNHIIELGDLMNQPTQAAAAKGYIGNIGMVVRRHLQGLRGVVSGTGGAGANIDAAGAAGHAGYMYLAHLLGHSVAGPAGSAAVLGTEAAHQMVLNKIATTPALAERLIYAAKHQVGERIVGPLLGAMLSNSYRQNQQEDKNAASQ